MSCIGNIVNQSIEAATNSSSPSFIPEPNALRIARTVLFSLIAALALVGNYVVCRAVWRNPGPKPIAHYLVSNLAFAEIVSMVCLVFTFHAYEPPYSWKLGRVMCKILEPLQIASLLVVTTTLAILAVYRCVLLIKPIVRKPTRKQTCCVILLSWVGSVGLSVPAGHFRVVSSYGYNCDIHLCLEVFPEGLKHYQHIYTISLFVINFALPLVVMAISYWLVSRKIREHILVIKRLRDEQDKAMSSTTQCSFYVQEPQMPQRQGKNQDEIELKNLVIRSMKEKNSNDQRSKHAALLLEKQRPSSQKLQNKNNMDLENDLLKLVFVLVIIFTTCYIPYQLQFLMYEFKVKAFEVWPHRHTFSRIVFTLTCLPSALHPLCYGMMSNFYYKAFLRIVACRDHKT